MFGGDRTRADYVSDIDFSRAYRYMQYENVLALRVCLETGMRISDVLNLTKNALDKRTIHYTAQKTGKQDTKVISPQLAKELKANVCGKWLFAGRSGDKPRTRQAVWQDLKRAAKSIHSDRNMTPHSTRKNYAVNVYHNKGLAAAQRELQHDNTTTTMLYAFSDVISTKKADTTRYSISEEDIDRIAQAVVDKLQAIKKEHG